MNSKRHLLNAGTFLALFLTFAGIAVADPPQASETPDALAAGSGAVGEANLPKDWAGAAPSTEICSAPFTADEA
jgi:hypothetical protein